MNKKLKVISNFVANINYMAGIYIHIPFCKSRCIYCDFYSTTLQTWQGRYVDALIKEAELRNDYLSGESIETIYFGGGTPSQLSIENMAKLLSYIRHYAGQDVKEFTIECNPDDITPILVETLVNCGVNRISMGAQTFSAERLHFLRRRHSPQQVDDAVKIVREAGIKNISIDLMFGFPKETLDDWTHDINHALALDIEHISAYSLMYEEDTPLHNMLKKGLIQEIDEELSRVMYYTLIDRLTEAGYEQYEISNFAKKGYRSKHNSNYWNYTAYLGLGAGAHSFNYNSRQWNAEDVVLYINKVEKGEIPFEQELLNNTTKYNDMITTALRTKEGINLDSELVNNNKDYILRNAKHLINKGLLAVDNGRLHLTKHGLYVSDDVMSDLILLD